MILWRGLGLVFAKQYVDKKTILFCIFSNFMLWAIMALLNFQTFITLSEVWPLLFLTDPVLTSIYASSLGALSFTCSCFLYVLWVLNFQSLLFSFSKTFKKQIRSKFQISTVDFAIYSLSIWIPSIAILWNQNLKRVIWRILVKLSTSCLFVNASGNYSLLQLRDVISNNPHFFCISHIRLKFHLERLFY